jgi:hypothetical protein
MMLAPSAFGLAARFSVDDLMCQNDHCFPLRAFFIAAVLRDKMDEIDSPVRVVDTDQDGGVRNMCQHRARWDQKDFDFLGEDPA